MIQNAQAQNRAAQVFQRTQVGGFSPVTVLLLAIMSCFLPSPKVHQVDSMSMRAPGSGLLAGGRDMMLTPVVNSTTNRLNLRNLIVRPFELMLNL